MSLETPLEIQSLKRNRGEHPLAIIGEDCKTSLVTVYLTTQCQSHHQSQPVLLFDISIVSSTIILRKRAVDKD